MKIMEHKIIYVIEEARIYGIVVKSCSRSDILIPRLNVSTTTVSHVFVIFFQCIIMILENILYFFFHAFLYGKKTFKIDQH